MLSYLMLMLVQICIFDRLTGWNFFFTLLSFPCSAYEGDYDNKKIFRNRRFISKATFSFLFLSSIAVLVLCTHTENLDGIGFSLQNSSTISNHSITNEDCKSICPPIEFDDFCNTRWKYLPQSQHLNILIVLCSLFLLSLLEWILESCYDFMPYRKLYKKD